MCRRACLCVLGDHRDSSASYGRPVLNASKMLCSIDWQEPLDTAVLRASSLLLTAAPISRVLPQRLLALPIVECTGLCGAGTKCQANASWSDAMASGRLLSRPSPAPTRSKSPLTPAAVDLDLLVPYRPLAFAVALWHFRPRERRGQSYTAALLSFVFRHRLFHFGQSRARIARTRLDTTGRLPASTRAASN